MKLFAITALCASLAAVHDFALAPGSEPVLSRSGSRFMTQCNIVDQTRMIGAVCLRLSVIIALPIPFGNMLPTLCILGIAVGMLQQDGALDAGSMTAGSLVVVGLSTVIALAGEAALAALSGFLV